MLATYIGETTVNDKVELEVYECPCGYHFGVDSTYLEQVGAAYMHCPSCSLYHIIDPPEEEVQ